MREVDTQRKLQAEEDEERAKVAFGGADRGQQQGGGNPCLILARKTTPEMTNHFFFLPWKRV